MLVCNPSAHLLEAHRRRMVKPGVKRVGRRSLGGSLAILADAMRGGLMLVAESYALLVLHRLHRGKVAGVEFGAGKFEVLCNVLIAAVKVVVSLWIAQSALAIIETGHSNAARGWRWHSPACLGAANVVGNVVAYEHVRDLTGRGRSAIMNSQLLARGVKVRCAVAVALALTVRATTAEPVIAAWADAIGGARGGRLFAPGGDPNDSRRSRRPARPVRSMRPRVAPSSGPSHAIATPTRACGGSGRADPAPWFSSKSLSGSTRPCRWPRSIAGLPPCDQRSPRRSRGRTSRSWPGPRRQA